MLRTALVGTLAAAAVTLALSACGQSPAASTAESSSSAPVDAAPSVAPTVADPGAAPAIPADCDGKAAGLTLRGKGRTVRVATRVCTPLPSGAAYWMVVRNSAGNYFPKYALPTSPATTDKINTLGAAVTPGSWRTYAIYRVPAPAVTWMREAFAHDASDSGWDGDRSQLPAGCTLVSEEVRYTVV